MDWDYSRHYARFHADSPAHDRNLEALFHQWLGPHLPADRTQAILDVGCGRGYALGWLRGLGYTQLSGLDTDRGQVAAAKERGLAVRHVTDSVADLVARPASADFVLLMDVLEHLPRGEDRRLLEAIHTVLRPGGVLLCTTPNADAPLANHWRHVDYTHHTAFTPESLDFLFSHAGLRLTAVQGLEFFPAPRWGCWPPNRSALRWWCRQLARIQPRLACIGELGWQQGRRVALSPNLLALAVRA